MHRHMTKPVREYYLQFKNEVPLFYSQRKNILRQVKYSLEMYADEHTDITPEILLNDFGSPSELADSLIVYESPKDIRKGLFLNKNFYIALAFLCLFIILITIAVLKITGSLATQGIIEYEEGTIKEETIGEETIEEEIIEEEIIEEEKTKE